MLVYIRFQPETSSSSHHTYHIHFDLRPIVAELAGNMRGEGNVVESVGGTVREGVKTDSLGEKVRRTAGWDL